MNNTKREIIENYNKLSKDGEIDEFLDSKVKDKFIDSYMYPSFSGWVYKIILDEDDIWITNCMSRTSGVMSCYDGEAIEVAEVDACSEFEDNLITDIDINSLTEDEKADLWNSLLDDEIVQELKDNFDEDNEELTLVDILKEEYCCMEEHFEGVLSEKYDNIKMEYVEEIWEDYFKGSILSEIEQSIEEIK